MLVTGTARAGRLSKLPLACGAVYPLRGSELAHTWARPQHLSSARSPGTPSLLEGALKLATSAVGSARLFRHKPQTRVWVSKRDGGLCMCRKEVIQLSLSLSNTHSHTGKHTYLHTLSFSPSLTPCLCPTHTFSLSLPGEHSLKHTHTPP